MSTSKPLIDLSFARGTSMVLVLLASGCAGSEQTITTEIPVVARVGDDAVRCGESYEGVGRSSSRFEPKGLLAYVHGIELLTEGGGRVPVELLDDGTWQGQGVARLDFGDGTGACTDDGETNRELRVRAPVVDDATGLAFRVGVPAELNHLDAAEARPPLDDPTAWWGWKSGYVFVQLTIATPLHDSYYAHVGSSSCDGSVEEGFSCAADNEILAELDGFELGRDGIRMDLGALLAGVDLEAPVDVDAGDSVPGCMSTPPDAECEPIFAALGVSFLDGGPGPEQVVFSREADAVLDP